MRPGTQAAALLYLLRLDLRRWQQGQATEAYNAYRVAAHRASTMVEVDTGTVESVSSSL